jgi:cyclophilin family peptidyl-prolyl cis-trans isomerase/HEAT repeat protein
MHLKRYDILKGLGVIAPAVSMVLGYFAPGGAAEDPYRTIASSEAARRLDPALVAALDGPPALAARAALAVGRTKRPEGAPALRARLDAADPSVRAMCAYGLGLLADRDSLDDERRLAHADPSSAVRYAAADAIGRIVAATADLATEPVALDLLTAAGADPDPLVRGHAAASLDAFRAAPFAAGLGAKLAKMFEAERDPGVRWHVMWTIARAYATHVPAAFLAQALHDRDELVRVEALRAWGRRSGPQALGLVQPLLADPKWRVQLEAREAVRKLTHLDPTEHLTELPADLNVPALEPPRTEVALPRPAPSGTPGPPALADGQASPSIAPTSAADMDGPLPGMHPRVRIHTTKGDIVVRLYPEWAPQTVANFLNLTQRAYYDNNRWFRVVPDFVDQTGDPNDNGEGDAGYAIGAEENPIEQRSGVISMGLNYANGAALRDSAGTQFYLTVSPQLHLDRDFTVFGEVERGFPVLARLIESDRMLRVERIADD